METTTIKLTSAGFSLFNKSRHHVTTGYCKNDILMKLDMPLGIGLNAPIRMRVRSAMGWEVKRRLQTSSGATIRAYRKYQSDVKKRNLDMRGKTRPAVYCAIVRLFHRQHLCAEEPRIIRTQRKPTGSTPTARSVHGTVQIGDIR